MTDQRLIYRDHATRYDALVRAEDVARNLGPAIDAIRPIEGADVLDVGAGTGRVTRLLLEHRARHVTAIDRERAMLEVARRSLSSNEPRVQLAVAAAEALPFAARRYDLAVAGWVFGHFCRWLPDEWRAAIGGALDDIERTVRPGGAVVVIETLGTGTDRPAPPNAALAEYYAWLEAEQGMTCRVIRTDYAFTSLEEAVQLIGFFFGAERAAHVRATGSTLVPECTGVWARRRRNGLGVRDRRG